MDNSDLASLFRNWRTSLSAGFVMLFTLLSNNVTFANNTSLDQSASPYLQGHSKDPIKWQQLTRQSLQDAKKTNQPIFITSGYQACYWCHRLKQDTFQNKLLAEKININFIPIIIDREIHTAEDNFLQEFMRTVMNTEGWPIMVILTPDGHPIFGYSYTDPQTLNRSLDTFLEYWRNDSATIIDDAKRSTHQLANANADEAKLLTDMTTGVFLKAFLDQASAAADRQHGGFGDNEKYPWAPQLLALVDLMQINPQPEVLAFISGTLDSMLQSALFYQVDHSVFRYSTTPDWRAPHFEQMLYTQALMIKLLTRVSHLTGHMRYGEAAARTARSMIENFQLSDGWFRSARAAVSPNNEDGGNYLWSRSELAELLGNNWEEEISDIGSGSEKILPRFTGSNNQHTRSLMREAQRKRINVTDDKPLTAWNGLALSALTGAVAFDQTMLAETKLFAEQLLDLARKKPLAYIANDGDRITPADLATAVYLAGGLIDWWQLIADDRFAVQAVKLLSDAFDLFYDNGNWKLADNKLLGPSVGSPALPDNQLPSPSGEWLRLSQLMWLADNENHATLAPMIAQATKSSTSTAMQQQAFFHGTTIAAKVVGDLLIRK